MEKKFVEKIYQRHLQSKPFLDKKEGVASWQVETNDADKVITVETESLEPKDIIKVIKRTGFVAEEMV